jgi:hypothetical protein
MGSTKVLTLLGAGVLCASSFAAADVVTIPQGTSIDLVLES